LSWPQLPWRFAELVTASLTPHVGDNNLGHLVTVILAETDHGPAQRSALV